MKGKRVFDLFVTLAAAIAWVPTLVLCALAILVTEGRPVFYVSRRVTGPGGRVSRVVKFRTMVRNAEALYNREVVPIQKDGVRFLNLPPNSPLYTRIGRLIERAAFTELPQLLLVLRGRMSLVGNRPLPESVMASLRDAYPQVDDRLLTPAGMTGPVQLIGRERLTDGQRLDLESTYCQVAIECNTWVLDFEILLFTVLEALRLRGPMTFGDVKQFLLSHGRRRSAAVESEEFSHCVMKELSAKGAVGRARGLESPAPSAPRSRASRRETADVATPEA